MNILLDILIGGTISLTFILVGEIITLEYPFSKFSKWWRKNIIENDSTNKYK